MVKFITEILTSDVITFQELVKLGKVEEVIINPADGAFVALRLITSEGDRYVPANEIKASNKGAILVNEINSLVLREDVVRINKVLECKPKIIGAKVYNEEGRYLGKVTDATINFELLALEKLYLKSGLSLKSFTDSLVIPAKNIVRIEKTKIIVSDNNKQKASDRLASIAAPVIE